MNNNLVSIIIPLYNAENYIKETIHSLLNQTHQNIEIIVIDDFSTDNSFQIVSTITSDKIKLIKNKKKGACAARNYGFEISKGEFIQYLDADDIISTTKIASQLELLQNNSEFISSCGWEKFTTEHEHLTPREQSINKSYNKSINWLIDSWSGEGMGLISIWLTPRNLIQKAGLWNEDLLINQDGEFFCRVLLHSTKIIFCEDVIAYYRTNPTGITQSKRSNEKIKSQLDSYKLCESHLKEHCLTPPIKKALGNLYLKFIYHNDRYNKEVTKIAWNYFNDLNIGKPWIVGGEKFKILASIIGFKMALKIINWIN